jgi:hypothetical protein
MRRVVNNSTNINLEVDVIMCLTLKYRCIKKVLWDNCMGQYVTAFAVGDVVNIKITSGDTGIAASPYYDGISDFVPLDHFEVVPYGVTKEDNS